MTVKLHLFSKSEKLCVLFSESQTPRNIEFYKNIALFLVNNVKLYMNMSYQTISKTTSDALALSEIICVLSKLCQYFVFAFVSQKFLSTYWMQKTLLSIFKENIKLDYRNSSGVLVNSYQLLSRKNKTERSPNLQHLLISTVANISLNMMCLELTGTTGFTQMQHTTGAIFDLKDFIEFLLGVRKQITSNN